VSVWVSPQVFSFETSPDVIKREALDSDESTRVLLRIDEDGTRHYDQNDEYLELYANVVSMQRGSKNNLRENFRKIREHMGWTVHCIDKDDDLSMKGNEAREKGRLLREENRIESLLSAKLITKDEYVHLIRLDKRTSLDDEQQFAMRRFEIESFYRQDLTEELAEKDGDGRLRREIRNYEIFRGSSVAHTETDIWEGANLVHITDKQHLSLWQKMMTGILKSANLTDKTGQLLIDTIIRGDELTTFSDYCSKHKNEIAQLYGLAIRRDIHKKSVSQLWEFLNLMGVRHRKLNTVKENGKKIYLYSIQEESVKFLEDILARRSDPDIQTGWHDKRGRRKRNRLFTKKNPMRSPRTYKTAIRGITANVLESIE